MEQTFPHGSVCWYPACIEHRVDACLYCAGHELYWRANFEIPSQFGTEKERAVFGAAYWASAKVEAAGILEMAGAPASSKTAVANALARAAADYDQEQLLGNVLNLSLPKVDNDESLESYISSGVYSGVLRRACGCEPHAGQPILRPQARAKTSGEVSTEIANSIVAIEQLGCFDRQRADKRYIKREQQYLSARIQQQLSDVLAAPGAGTEPESGE